jgi:hypothetical protein
MTPLIRTEATIAFAGAVQVIRRQFDALYLLFEENRVPGLIETAPWLSDSAALAFTVMVYMGIVKLFDPEESLNSSRKRNLVLRWVIDEVGGERGTKEREALEAEYRKLEPLVVKLKEWRNKIGAHSDFIAWIAIIDHAMSNGATPHPAPFIPIAELKAAVQGLSSISDTLVKMYVPEIGDWYGDPIAPEVERLAEFFDQNDDRPESK